MTVTRLGRCHQRYYTLGAKRYIVVIIGRSARCPTGVMEDKPAQREQRTRRCHQTIRVSFDRNQSLLRATFRCAKGKMRPHCAKHYDRSEL